MDEDLTSAVAEHRGRLGQLRQEVDRLEALLAELEGAPPGRATARELRRARKDLERARRTLEAHSRAYALFRLRQAIGPDPEWLDRQTFEWTLMELSSRRLARGAAGASASRISYETLRELLLADLPVGQVVENERAERRSAIHFATEEGEGATKTILRRWAAMTQQDPYVAEALARSRQTADRFSEALARCSQALETARINYEMRARRSDEARFETRNGRLALVAVDYWDNIAETCPEEATDLMECFAEMEQAREDLRGLRDELNEELRAFMREFVPRYLTYASRQSAERRRALGLARAPLRRLCRYLLDQIDDTDFLLPGGGGLEVAVPRLPEGLGELRRSAAYRRFREVDEAADASA